MNKLHRFFTCKPKKTHTSLKKTYSQKTTTWKTPRPQVIEVWCRFSFPFRGSNSIDPSGNARPPSDLTPLGQLETPTDASGIRHNHKDKNDNTKQIMDRYEKIQYMYIYIYIRNNLGSAGWWFFLILVSSSLKKTFHENQHLTIPTPSSDPKQLRQKSC